MTNASQKTSQEKIKEAKEVLNLMANKEGQRMLLNNMVNHKELTNSEAGKITLDNNL